MLISELMTSIEASLTNITFNTSTLATNDFQNLAATNRTVSDEDAAKDDSVILQYVIFPLGLVTILLFLLGLVAFLVRKKRLDKLRHHLMPLYSFDPTEEGEDWEAELLEEGTDHNPRGKSSKPSDQPQLSFHGNL